MVKKAIIAERDSQFDQGAVLRLLHEEKQKNQLNLTFVWIRRSLEALGI